MEMIKIPNTDLLVSRLIYGCMRIGGDWNSFDYSNEHKEYVYSLLDVLMESGINFYDHADIYTNGKSERLFGEYLKERKISRDKVIIQSKCGIRRKDDPEKGLVGRYDFSKDYIISSVENILKRLQTDYLDILLLHRPDLLCEPEEVVETFNYLKNKGMVRYFGVSNHTPLQIELLQKYLSFKLITNQIEISLQNYGVFEQEITFNNIKMQQFNTYDILNYCRLNDISIQAWSPLGKGFINNDQTKQELKNYLNELAEKYNSSIDAIQIAFLLRHPAKIQPVLGSTNLERIKELLKSIEIKLKREEWYKIFTLARGEAIP